MPIKKQNMYNNCGNSYRYGLLCKFFYNKLKKREKTEMFVNERILFIVIINSNEVTAGSFTF